MTRRRPFIPGDRVEVIGALPSTHYLGVIPLTISSTATVVRAGQMQALIKVDWVHNPMAGDDHVRTVPLHKIRLRD